MRCRASLFSGGAGRSPALDARALPRFISRDTATAARVAPSCAAADRRALRPSPLDARGRAPLSRAARAFPPITVAPSTRRDRGASSRIAPRPHGRRPLTGRAAQAADRRERARAAATTQKKMGRTTAADKKKMLLKIYHTKKEPFNLKELTKLAKAAGLAEKLVQDVNTQLMDDNYVSSDKIGTGNYFWAFPRVARRAGQEAARRWCRCAGSGDNLTPWERGVPSRSRSEQSTTLVNHTGPGEPEAGPG